MIRRLLIAPVIVATCAVWGALSVVYVMFASGWDGVINDTKVLFMATVLLATACILAGHLIRRG